jgi:hypothetical protein
MAHDVGLSLRHVGGAFPYEELLRQNGQGNTHKHVARRANDIRTRCSSSETQIVGLGLGHARDMQCVILPVRRAWHIVQQATELVLQRGIGVMGARDRIIVLGHGLGKM